ncbi:MAG: 16S rRNA processing protein RimM [Clostridia bacterium]|nr:16S rRNA processing protein RimM [Clostridia bacterium]
MILDFLEIGQIVGTHGIKGEMRVNPWCDTPDFFISFKKLYFDKLGQNSVEIVSSRVHGNVVLLKLDGIESLEQAIGLKNKILYIKREDAKLEEGSYFVSELIGCKVKDIDTGAEYGVISEVSVTGANDVWHINNGKKEYLIPAIPDVVITTDVENGIIEIRPLKGIFDDEN